MSDGGTDLPEGTRPGRVALTVTDLDRQVGFYRDVIGLTVGTREGDRATLGTGARPLLELRQDPDAPERSPAETGLYHTAFLLPTRDALAEALQRVRERWRLDGASDHGVSEALYLTDPEGNGIELYRDRPRDAWPTTEDGNVAMRTDALDADALADLASGTGGIPAETTVGHVHLEVSDLYRAERFYADALGLDVRQRYGMSALFLAADDYHHHVGLNTWGNRTERPTGRGLDWFELLVPDAAALDAAEARLQDAGAPVSRTADGLQVTDPDGIAIWLRSQ